MTYPKWYSNIYPRLTGQGLWLRGGEMNTLSLDEYESRFFRVLWVRLSTYFDTGYSFTHQLLYQIAANTAEVFPDLAYLPPRSDLTLFRQHQIPWLLGTQTKRGPQDFDLIGFSVSVIQELLNLWHFLRESNMPLGKKERLARPDVPLFILGGASALYSSVLWTDDPLVDAIFIGEDPLAIRHILEICREGKRQGMGKREVLDQLTTIPGVFEPDQHPISVKKATIFDLDQAETLACAPVQFLSDAIGSAHLQISEGCPCFCSFCAESWDRKPYRERSLKDLCRSALAMKANMGIEELQIYSSNFNTYSDFYPLLENLVPLFSRLGLKSQRFDFLAHDPELLKFQMAVEKRSLTCGMEGISPRLRRYLHKNLESAELEQAFQAIFKNQARELKIFLIATGLEEEADFQAFNELLSGLKKMRAAFRASTRLIFSITPLVRFPGTPLEFEDAPSLDQLRPILRRFPRLIQQAGFEFRESADLIEYWVSQVLVRAARKKVGLALQQALKQTGFIYYRNVEQKFFDNFILHLKATGLDHGTLLQGHTLTDRATKPWAGIETGITTDFIWQQTQQARAFNEKDYCLGRSWHPVKCLKCGACPTAEQVHHITHARQSRPLALDELKQRIQATQQQEVPVRFLVNAQIAARGLPRKMLAVQLARALMLSQPELVPFYRRAGSAFWELSGGNVWLEGEDVLTLFFDQAALNLLEQMAAQPISKDQVNGHLADWGDWKDLVKGDWQPSQMIIHSPFSLDIDTYAKPLGLKYMLRKQTLDAYALELTRDSIKKGIFRQLSWSKQADGTTEARLIPGPKFRPDEFLQRAFHLEHPADWVRTRLWVNVVPNRILPYPPIHPAQQRLV